MVVKRANKKQQSQSNSPEIEKTAQSPQSEEIEQFDIVKVKPGSDYATHTGADNEYSVAEIYNRANFKNNPYACIVRPGRVDGQSVVANVPLEELQLVRKSDRSVLPKAEITGVFNRGGLMSDYILTSLTDSVEQAHFYIETLMKQAFGFVHPGERVDIPHGCKMRVTFEVLEVPEPPEAPKSAISFDEYISEQFPEKPF